jgi:hypothetical protein
MCSRIDEDTGVAAHGRDKRPAADGQEKLTGVASRYEPRN